MMAKYTPDFAFPATNTRVRLLEVDVDSDRFDVVERVFLIEWQTKVALEFHLGSFAQSHKAIWSNFKASWQISLAVLENPRA